MKATYAVSVHHLGRVSISVPLPLERKTTFSSCHADDATFASSTALMLSLAADMKADLQWDSLIETKIAWLATVSSCAWRLNSEARASIYWIPSFSKKDLMPSTNSYTHMTFSSTVVTQSVWDEMQLVRARSLPFRSRIPSYRRSQILVDVDK